MWLVYFVPLFRTLLITWCPSLTMPRVQLLEMCVNSLHSTSWTHTPIYIIFILLCSLSLLYLSIAGRAEARVVGSFHPRPSSPYSHDWNPHRSPVGNLRCFQSFCWAVSFFSLRIHRLIFYLLGNIPYGL